MNRPKPVFWGDKTPPTKDDNGVEVPEGYCYTPTMTCQDKAGKISVRWELHKLAHLPELAPVGGGG
jgi:hypothetical protein